MQYLVVGSDGNEYGPADVATLTQWVTEGRLHPSSSLKDPTTGSVTTADKVPGLFPQAAPPLVPPPAQPQPGYGPQVGPNPQPNWSQAPSPYLRQQQYAPVPSRSGNVYFWNSIGRSAAALIFFFLLGGIGLIFSAYSVYYGWQAMSHDHKHGKLAFGISIVVTLAVIVGWIIRIQHVASY